MEKEIYKLNHLVSNFKKLMLLMAMLFISLYAFSFSGGSYTINPAGAASSTNYLSINAFVNDLRNLSRGDGGAANYAIGGAGVQGAITVDITTGSATFSQQVTISAILGVNATNTITINGNGNTLSFTPTSSAAGGVLDLNGADYFTFNNLTIINNATFGYCVWVRNAADFNRFNNCSFRCPSMTGAVTGTAYIWISNGTTSPFNYANAGNNNQFNTNNLSTGNSNGPYYGIVMAGPTSSSLNNATSGNKFIKNNIQNWRYCGFFISYTSNTEFTDNTVHNTDYTVTSFKYGIYLNYSTGTFERNRIYNIDGSGVSTNSIYPVYYYNFNNATRNSALNNNSIHCRTTGFNYNYIYNYASFFGSSLSIVNNTFAHVSGTTINNNSTTYVIYGGYWNTFTNNILSCDYQGTGTKYLYYDFSGVSPANFINNNFDLRCSGNPFYGYVGTQRASMNDMYSAGFKSSNIATDPSFINENTASDLHPTSLSMCNKGIPVTGVDKDLRGVTRNTSTPDVGAIEYYLDLSMNTFTLPLPNPLCAGYSVVTKGTIKNNSNFPITGVKVATLLNAKSAILYNIPGTLNAGDTFAFTFTDKNIFGKSGNNTIQLYSNHTDDSKTNDTISKSFFVTPSPGGSVITHALNSPGIFDYQNRGYSVNPVDEVFEMNMTAPRKYSSNDYNTKWNNTIWVTTESGTLLPNNSITYNHAQDGKISFTSPAQYVDSVVWLYVRVNDFQTTCDTVFKRKIIIAPKGQIKYSLPTVICDGSEIYFENLSTVSSGFLTYQWDFGDGSNTDDATSPVHLFPDYGTYKVKLRTVTSPYGFFKDSTFTINVNEIPDVKFKVINACEGGDVQLNNLTVIGNGAINYLWDMGDNTGTSTKTNPKYNYAKPGAYKVVLKATSNGCTSETSRNAYLLAKPVADFNFNSTNFCQNELIKFNNLSTISNGELGCLWSFGESNTIGTNQNPEFDYLIAGSKSIKLTSISEFGCIDSIRKTIVIKAAPMSDFKVDYTCNSKPSQFVNQSTTPAGSTAIYSWNFSDGTPSTSMENPLINWNTTGKKTIELIAKASNGCEHKSTQLINVGEAPIAKFQATENCSNEPTIFRNQTFYNQGKIEYNWDFGDGNTSTNMNPTYKYKSNVTATYTARLIANIIGGCSDTFIQAVTVTEIPSACDFDIIRTYTSGMRNYEFKPKGSTGNLNFIWFSDDGNNFSSKAEGISYNFLSDKKYCMTMTAQNNAGCECQKTKCFNITSSINGIDNFDHLVNVYPNPNSGIFNVAIDESIQSPTSFKIYDVLGTLIISITSTNPLSTIDLSSYSTGVYLLEINSDKLHLVKKITIVK
jgi:PKD repeat protein